MQTAFPKIIFAPGIIEFEKQTAVEVATIVSATNQSETKKIMAVCVK